MISSKDQWESNNKPGEGGRGALRSYRKGGRNQTGTAGVEGKQVA